MNARSFLRFFTSAKLTVVILCVLAVLLLLNVALPQEAVLGPESFAALHEGRPVATFFLDTLGFGRMSTSPAFLAVLGIFFVNLIVVLAHRVGPTWRRIALKPRSAKGLQAWARLEEALTATLPTAWNPGHAAQTLRGFGYQVRKPGERTLWAVKHRTAPLGFLLFHVSFLLIFAGGVLVYYTRFVGSVVLSEGQEFAGQYAEVLRQRPLGPPPPLSFTVEGVDPRFERGEPVHLSAVFRFRQPGSSDARTSEVNHPARWGTTSLLVNRAGLAPVLWLQDSNGFTADRVVTPARTRGAGPSDITLNDGRTTVIIRPLDADRPFPSRDELPSTSLGLMVTQDSQVVFDGELRPGEAAPLENGRLVLEEVRYWVGVTVVSERGGGLLITGFVVGIVGVIWRLLWYRREVALTWDDRDLHLVGRSEYFTGRFQEELRSIRDTLARGEAVKPAPRTAEA